MISYDVPVAAEERWRRTAGGGCWLCATAAAQPMHLGPVGEISLASSEFL